MSAPTSASSQALAAGFTVAGRRRRSRRYLVVTLLLALAALALWWAEVLAGDTWYPPSQVLAVMSGQEVPGASFVIGELRLPRAVTGLLAGLAFGMAGRTSQTMLRNELASPDIIGITSGASTAAVFGILVLGWSGTRLSLMAVAAGVATAAVIFALSGRGRSQGGRLILIGIGVAAMFSSLTAYLQLRANAYDVADAMRWLSGSLGGARWEQVPLLAGAVVLGGAALAAIARSLRVLPLGEEAATGLGEKVERSRAALVLALVVLSACATAASGPIAFVSFLAGPLVARLAGPSDRVLLAPSALMGAVIVLGGDLAGQYLFPTALPVGVVTGIVGAPYLLAQLVRLNRQGASA
ncbi:MAG: iron ABC transporter permease [Actinomyces urogenitalis]|uniref:FecCD family ABC transporter permease n=1 Tax=Actinomyces urogenitalis TaxID=103621 RepID=UPI002A82FF7D|nr:iron ABC transporter permease [Actinomyces urogenitalis]MDY3677620.1 iron ABC transporter permease [Actinomyces urogenitalis]